MWRILIALSVVAGGCGDDGGTTNPSFDGCEQGGDVCEPASDEGAGDWARYCVGLGSGESGCVNVCNQPANERTVCRGPSDCGGGSCIEGFCYVGTASGRNGDLCEFDGDCGSDTTCDNDSSNGSICRCIPNNCVAPTDIGIETDLASADPATVNEEEVWNTSWSCCDERAGEWVASESAALFRDSGEASRTLFADRVDGQRRVGFFCSDSFSWALEDTEQAQNGSFRFVSQNTMTGDASGTLWIGSEDVGLTVRYECTISGVRGGEPPSPTPCRFSCPDPEIDITGTFQGRFNCAQGNRCVVDDEERTIVIRPSEREGVYEFGDPNSDWQGVGLLCGTTFRWTAQTTTYEEVGVWTFTSDGEFHHASDYTDADEATACTGEAILEGSPPKPGGIGGC